MQTKYQFFIVDKKDVINCTAFSNNQLRVSGTKNYAQFIQIVYRLLTDLDPILLDKSRVGNQPIY